MSIFTVAVWRKVWRRDPWGVGLGVTAVFAFVLYAWFSLGAPALFNSPDETANYFFLRQLSEHTRLKVSDPLNAVFAGTVAPRSVGVYQDAYVPGSFYGIILLYGVIGRVLGSWILLLLTPLFAAFSVVLFHFFLRQFFSRRVAFLASVLLLLHPAYWYFASRGMYHNMLFLNLLMIAAFCWMKLLHTQRLRFALLTAFTVSWALIVRTSEVVWVSAMVLTAAVLLRHRIRRAHAVAAFMVVVVSLAMVLILNTYWFGHPTAFPYATSSVVSTSIATTAQNISARILKAALPFGWHWETIKTTVASYGISLFAWYTVLIGIGLAAMLRSAVLRVLPSRELVYSGFAILLTLWLWIYYGSGTFLEYGDANERILNASYLRYWLPAFAVAMPFAAKGLEWCATQMGHRRVQRISIALVVLLVALLGFAKVYLDPLHGLVGQKQNVQKAAAMRARVLALTEDQAIILSGSSDKILFPERHVVFVLSDDPVTRRQRLVQLAATSNLYLSYNPQDLLLENVLVYLADAGLRTEQVAQLTGLDTLYRVIQRER